MLNDDKENRMKVRLLYEKPRSNKPNKTITKEQPAMIYLDLKRRHSLFYQTMTLSKFQVPTEWF
jgi:hypothetical protein